MGVDYYNCDFCGNIDSEYDMEWCNACDRKWCRHCQYTDGTENTRIFMFDGIEQCEMCYPPKMEYDHNITEDLLNFVLKTKLDNMTRSQVLKEMKIAHPERFAPENPTVPFFCTVSLDDEPNHKCGNEACENVSKAVPYKVDKDDSSDISKGICCVRYDPHQKLLTAWCEACQEATGEEKEHGKSLESKCNKKRKKNIG